MTPSTILYSASDRIARVTLNRPERLNAITIATGRDLRQAVERAK